jgi:geranylgeranyl reductase family protein
MIFGVEGPFVKNPTSPPVMVVGAGPAGATAALALAAGGVPVRLLDRSVFPRNKPCGGGISMRVLRRFPYLDGALQRIVTHSVSRLYLEGSDGHGAIIRSDAPAALMIRRVEFDALLVSLAVDAGAELVSGVDIVNVSRAGRTIQLIARDGRHFESDTLVAADGVHSVVARRLGLNRGWPAASIALDMMEETPRSQLRDVDPSTLWVAYGYGGPGYAYIFPKRDHVNIGIGYVLSHYRCAIDASPYELQLGFVDSLRARGIVVGESVRRNFTPFLIPVGGPLRRPGNGRVLVAGDAGGFVNAFTAEGIYYAMVSGDLAARTIIECGADAARSDLSTPYRRACDREIGPELRDSVLIQRYLFSNPRRIERLVRGARHHDAITNLILDYAIGRRSYRAIRRRVLARAPHLALSLIAAKAFAARARSH